MALPESRRADLVRGLFIYAAGDTLAALLSCGFSVWRLLGVMAVGALVYSYEIPAWFAWINLRFKGFSRAGMAVLYFNPLWIARHLCWISLFTGRPQEVTTELLIVSLKGFAVNLPIVFAVNYLIQNVISLRWRFLSSAVFSSMMAVYYPLCRVIFR